MRRTKKVKIKKRLFGDKIMEGNILPAETFRRLYGVVAFKLREFQQKGQMRLDDPEEKLNKGIEQ